jgi:hypothetical protein
LDTQSSLYSQTLSSHFHTLSSSHSSLSILNSFPLSSYNDLHILSLDSTLLQHSMLNHSHSQENTLNCSYPISLSTSSLSNKCRLL